MPLSIAFINKNGFITDIEDLDPHDEISKGPSCPVTCALEMKKGFFKNNKIDISDQVFGLPDWKEST